MNNSTNNATLQANENIQEAYQNYVYNLTVMSNLALLLYATMLIIAEEVKYMWSRTLSLVFLLYIFARYGTLVFQILIVWLGFLSSGSLCNDVANVVNVLSLLGYAGIQGILIIRAISLCPGNKVVPSILTCFFLGGLSTNLYDVIIFEGCNANFSTEQVKITLFGDICTILSDLCVLGTCWWKVWGTWKLKRETGIQGNGDLVSVLLEQLVSRCGFVIIITFVATIVAQFINTVTTSALDSYQRALSAIMITQFTLDLRRQNSPMIRARNVTLPNIQFRSLVNYIHQSILVEMGDHEDPEASHEGDDDDVPRPADDTAEPAAIQIQAVCP